MSCLVPCEGWFGCRRLGANWLQRLDLNMDNFTTVTGDAVMYRGVIGNSCT